MYRGTSLIRKRTPLGPYRRPMPRVLGGVLAEWACSYARGAHVERGREEDQNGHQPKQARLLYRGTSLIRNSHPPRITIGP